MGDVATNPARRALGHIDALVDMPRYRSILTHGREARLTIPIASKLRRIVLLLDSGGRFVMVSVKEEVGGPVWLHLIEQGKKLGYPFAGYYTSEARVLEEALSAQERTEALADSDESDSTLNQIIAESATIEWLRSKISHCIDLRTTDLHIEVRGRVATLRIRRDGILRVWQECPANEATAALAACFTILAEDRSRSQAAFNQHSVQSALIPMRLERGNVKLRYQSHPAVGGYDVVIRILKDDAMSSATLPSLDKLGYTPSQVGMLKEALEISTGGIFIAGITGSGKTTTLSTMLARLAESGDRKIISIEDPVEYQINGVSHLSIQRGGGGEGDTQDNPFAPAMLAFLRMDPDIGMFGEIRDALSAEMAYTTIQTGHKLLSTVHATSALGIIPRLTSRSFGLTRQDVCSTEFISALVYQVLVPRNCTACAVPADEVLSEETLRPYRELFHLDTRQFRCASHSGCSQCTPGELARSGSQGHIGVLGMKVGAEIILPDIPLLSHLMTGDDVGARSHWRNQQKSRFDEDGMEGKPAWAHTLYDVTRGEVDPFHFERTFGPPQTLLRR